MNRFLIGVYGVFAYAVGMAGLSYFFLFMGSWDFLPLHINSRTPGPLGAALLINTGLIALFGIQHSVMARQGFKKGWTKGRTGSGRAQYLCADLRHSDGI